MNLHGMQLSDGRNAVLLIRRQPSALDRFLNRFTRALVSIPREPYEPMVVDIESFRRP